MSFETLNLDPALQRALATAGYAEPTEVQRRAIPPALALGALLGALATACNDVPATNPYDPATPAGRSGPADPTGQLPVVLQCQASLGRL